MYDTLPVEQNLKFFAELYGITPERATLRINGLLERLNANFFRQQKLGALSTGMLKRASLPRVFLSDPEILLLDEAVEGHQLVATHYGSLRQPRCLQGGFGHNGDISVQPSIDGLDAAKGRLSIENLRCRHLASRP